MSNSLEEQVKEALEKVRPYLQADNGDVEFVEMTEDNIVYVRLKGACAGCPMSQMTLRAGIERSLMKAVPSIKRVEAVK
ncbi:MAG: NifU family protein [Ignavibacteriales bacterium]|nr:NifU family protein [Ignavibacteriales bacterium]